MSINRVDFPTTPNPVDGDWAKLVELMTKAFQNINSPLQIVGSNIPDGATFQIGGVVYYTNGDTAISGTASNYVKLTPNSGDSGATCDASFVADLTGVTWNTIRNGYYDTSGNLYIFDEVAAILAGHLSGSNSKFSQLFNAHLGQDLRPNASPTFNVVNASKINTGYGENELYAPPNFGPVLTTPSTNVYLEALSVGQLGIQAITMLSYITCNIRVPTNGRYSYSTQNYFGENVAASSIITTLNGASGAPKSYTSICVYRRLS